MNLRPTLLRPFAIAVVVAAGTFTSVPAAAADASILGRASTHVGRWIAAQGNAALRQILDDAQRELDERLQPMLPERDNAPETPRSVEAETRVVADAD